jgi:hypothetical protein
MNSTILIFAMRHALPRTSSAPYMVVREIKRQWQSLSYSDRELIESEIRNTKLSEIGDPTSWLELLNWITNTGNQIV